MRRLVGLMVFSLIRTEVRKTGNHTAHEDRGSHNTGTHGITQDRFTWDHTAQGITQVTLFYWDFYGQYFQIGTILF